jgi:energy-coupling factor transporter ATP-binding protein EcfA2
VKLSHVRIRALRSVTGEVDFTVGEGVNYIVGPNNSGKSNLLRALELALDPEAVYDTRRDQPVRTGTGGMPLKTRITLTFKLGTSRPEKTLQASGEKYELAVRGDRQLRGGGNSTFAEDGEIHFVTEFGAGGARTTSFQAKNMGARSLKVDSDEHVELERKFRRAVRFAVVHSGEDVATLLQGKFRDILNLVLSEHLRDEVKVADEARDVYLDTLKKKLLEPLRELVEARVHGVFNEIGSVELVPAVDTVKETLASVDVRLTDTFTSALADKGTGVRGAVLISMLQYLAEQSRRSLVLAVEEPESFLHPGAQESLRGELELLGGRADVTLVVSTHSPHVVSRVATTLVTQVEKGLDGVTRVSAQVDGTAPLTRMLGSLYADPDFLDFVDAGLGLTPDIRTVVVTEGYTDGLFIEEACRAAGRVDLIEGVRFLPAGGTKRLVPAAILAKAVTSRPVIALLDWDENGKVATDRLAGIDHEWKKNTNVLSLVAWPGRCKSGNEVEIEDLLPAAIVADLIAELGADLAVDQATNCRKCTRSHYKLSTAWKEAAIVRLPAMLRASSESPDALVWLAAEIVRRAEKLRS